MQRLSASILVLIFCMMANNLFAMPVCADPSDNSAKIAKFSPQDSLVSDQNTDQNSPSLSNQNINQIPELKLDLPKLDIHKPEPPAKRNPLKGSIQHQEVIKNKQQGTLGNSNGVLDGNTSQGALNGSVGRGQQKSRLNSKIKESDELGLGIIGVKFIMGFGRAPVIYQVFPGTPAFEAGVHVRDVILAVDGIPTMGLSKDEVYNMIVGQPNTDVTISFRRKNDFLVRTLTRMDLNKIGDQSLRRDYLRM